MAYYFRLPTTEQLTSAQLSALNEPNPIKIIGGPGTGKSVVSLWRHIRNHATKQKRSLLLTYTKTLETYLRESAKALNNSASEAVDRTYNWTTNNLQHFEEIIVDEAQDVHLDKYLIIQSYAETVCYGADEDQSIYLSKQELLQLMNGLRSMFPMNKVYNFDENFRNTFEIIQFVKALFPNRLINQSNIKGVKPVLIITGSDSTKKKKALLEIIKQFRSTTHNIAVLLPLVKHVDECHSIISSSGIGCSKFTNHHESCTIDNVHITTFKSSKGTEFDTVIIPDFDDMEYNISQYNVVNESDYYVALTRTRRNLYLLSSSHPQFLQRSQAQINTYSKEVL